MTTTSGNPARPTTPTPQEYIPFGGDPLSDAVWEESVRVNNMKDFGRKRIRYFRSGKFVTNAGGGNLGKKSAKKRPNIAKSSQFGAKVAKTVSNKTATSLLNEAYPGLEYHFDDAKGPAHEPCFTVRVLHPENGKEYIAIGGSKKIAKNNIAMKILKDFGVEVSDIEQEPKTQPVAVVKPKPVPTLEAQISAPMYHAPQEAKDIDFASDDIIMSDDPFPYEGDFGSNPVPLFHGFNNDPKLLHRIKNIQNLEENACLAVNCLMTPSPAVYEEISEEGPSHSKVFTYKLTFMSMEAYGKGPSKKKAKADAARQVLIEIFGPQTFQMLLQNCAMNPTEPEPVIPAAPEPEEMLVSFDDPIARDYNLAFSDRVHRMVQYKYDAIMKDDPEHAAQKVLAGVIMTKGTPLVDNAEVIIVTTGTKCIEGDSMSELGVSVNDCHAEILATRCLRDFLYTQIERCSAGQSSIVELTDSISEFRFQVKSDIRFHLYISTSPCGDARIFSPKGVDEQLDLVVSSDTHPNRLNRGVLRAKIEAGEGTIPVSNLPTTTQTWDAILQGNALNTMSCSDKLCRWNVLGFQGALLSMLVGPIYYSSVILGSLHHPIHFRRAIIGRIEPLESEELPAEFRVAKPHRLMVSSEEPRRVKKSPNHAITWCTTWSAHEVLAAAKGRCKLANIPSRVSKRHAFTRFLKIYRNNPAAEIATTDISYADAKLMAKSFQLVKQKFNNLMEESNLGKWISKPVEADSFRLV